jgi:D-glycero-D-manno-heptose 1,7-bisphosphate phosphatase
MTENEISSVGILIPNFNHKNFITTRIESVLNQTYSNITVHIIDDHSTDGSWEVIESFGQKDNIKIHRNATNSGSPFSSYFQFLSSYQYDYWWIAESDDFAAEDFLESLISVLERDKNISFAFSSSNVIDKNDKFIGTTRTHLEKFFPEVDWARNQIIDSEFGLKLLTRGQFVPNMSSMVFRSDSVNLNEISNISRFKLAGDWKFIIAIQAAGKAYYFKEELNSFRAHSESVRENTKNRARISEYLYCNFFAWEKSSIRERLDLTIDKSLIMARDSRVNLISLFFELNKLSSHLALRFIRALSVHIAKHPLSSIKRAISYIRLIHYLKNVLGIKNRSFFPKSSHLIFLSKVLLLKMKFPHKNVYELLHTTDELCAQYFISRIQKASDSKSCILMDRDGTILEPVPYLNELSRVKYIPEVIEIARLANKNSIPLYIVTNQAGVAHGYFTEEELIEFNLKLLQDIFFKFGVYFDGLIYCPSHPQPANLEAANECNCRKPYPGMIFRAISESGVQISNTGMLGDSESDYQAAVNAGLAYYWRVNAENRQKIKVDLFEWISGRLNS